MICSNCKNVYENLSFCPLCKTPYVQEEKKDSISNIDYLEKLERYSELEDISLTENFKSIDKDKLYFLVNYYSKKYYDMALAASKKRQITNAIEYAKMSVFFDADNKEARNILGLCYLEIGRVGEASYEFLLSCFIDDKESNLANTYISVIEKNVLESEQYDISIECYNKALDYIKKNNIRQALAELEISIKNNEKFLDAYLLLALGNLVLKDYQNTLKYAEKALEIDFENSSALKYISEVNIYKTNDLVHEKRNSNVHKFEETRISKTSKENSNSKGNNRKKGMLVGALIGCAFATVLLLTLDIFFNSTDEKYELLKLENTSLQQKYDIAKAQYEEDTKELEEKYNAVVNENILLTTTSAEESAKSNLDTAVMYYNLDDPIKTATYLKYAYDANLEANNIGEGSELDTVDIELYNDLMSKTYDEAAIFYFEEGTEAFESEKYDIAIESYEKSIFFYEQIDSLVKAVDSYYWLGRSYEAIENIEKAIETYNYILETYKEYSLNNEIKDRVTILGE